MPVTMAEWLWWAFNATLLILVFYIKKDTKKSTDLQERNQRNNHKLYVFLMQMNARCNILHPDRPSLSPPEWED